MYQVIFGEQSAKVFKEFPQERQLKLIESLSELSPAVLESAEEPLRSFKRAKMTYYRYKTDDLRFYFSLKDDTINCVYILNKNSWADFRLRTNLKKLSDAEVESSQEFIVWLEGR